MCGWQFFSYSLAEPPKITTHPQEIKETVSGKPVSFTVQATGTKPLSYQWQWKPVVEGVHKGEWQNLSSGGSVQGVDTATLSYSSIEACSEGLYQCVVTNVVGEEISEYTDHIIGEYQLSCQQQYSCAYRLYSISSGKAVYCNDCNIGIRICISCR